MQKTETRFLILMSAVQVACYNTNHKFVGFELDEYYYKVSKQRLDTEMAQMRLSDYIGGTV